MTTVTDMLRRFEKVNLQDEIQQSLYDSREEYVAQQREQMQRGIANDGNIIGRYANSKYALEKYLQSSKAGFGNVDLKRTGEYQSELFVEVRDDEIIIASAAERSKVFSIEDKYGNRIYGLYGKYRTPFVAFAHNALQKRIAEVLRLSTEQLIAV